MPNDNTPGSITTGIYIDRDLPDIITAYLKQADCRSRNEFINKAIRHYIAFLQKENDNEFLTPALESVLSGLLGDTENRLARILFKLATELSMLLHVTASQYDITEDEIDNLRKFCVDEVSRLNGSVNLKAALRHQRGG
jgi:metal-responsive CopG/Arc/MetJ family transcriptional regulator